MYHEINEKEMKMLTPLSSSVVSKRKGFEEAVLGFDENIENGFENVTRLVDEEEEEAEDEEDTSSSP
jgi:hypothetical protein